ncbi:MAG: hypothetical protein U0K57_04145 [Lachnospiraceae bacterium]|nr:hypothetical protein [Lachnospiraceae bacterium]
MLVSSWGGMTFLIPYFIFVVLIGATGVVSGIALGRSTGSGPVGAFGKATKYAGHGEHVGKAIGLIPVLGSLAMAIAGSSLLNMSIVDWLSLPSSQEQFLAELADYL